LDDQQQRRRRYVERHEIGINSGVYEDGDAYVAIKPDGHEVHLEPDDAGLAGYEITVAAIEARTDRDWLAALRTRMGDDDSDNRHELAELHNMVRTMRGKRRR
jgi:hypothetical protein